MANMDLLLRSLSYIEDHLDSEIQTEDICQACYTSKSSLEKLFRMSAHFSVHDYIIRRRMMKAAKLMIQKPEMSLLDVAVQYGYSSHEAFTRTFNNVWNCNPSEFRDKYASKGLIPELFPQITGFFQLKGENYMRRAVDISEMYDFIRERKDCYFVCCDVVFRIGHDEFAMLTNSTDKNYAEEIKNKIMAMNGQTFDFEDKKIPLNLYGVVTKLEAKSIKYAEVFSSLIGAINEEKYKVDNSEE